MYINLETIVVHQDMHWKYFYHHPSSQVKYVTFSVLQSAATKQ